MRQFGLDHSVAEHVADGVIHGLGVLFAACATTGLMVWAVLSLPAAHIAALSIYGAGLLACFSLSAAYNVTLHSRARAVLRRLDHATIYLMIAGTYTPLALIGIGGANGLWLTLIVWVIAAVGITLKLLYFERFARVEFALYLLQGWLSVLAFGPMMDRFSSAVLLLVALGGLTYTLGTIFHLRDHWPFNRAIWHAMVLAAAASHFAAVIAVSAPSS